MNHCLDCAGGLRLGLGLGFGEGSLSRDKKEAMVYCDIIMRA
jgi:hypothetical protein